MAKLVNTAAAAAHGGVSTSVSTRREFLKAFGVAAAAAGVLTSCDRSSGGGGGSGEDVTLKVAGDWPYGPMPDAKTRRTDANAKAYAEALQDWKDKNPGVTLKPITLNIWDQQTLTTAVTGGTAPSFYPGNVLGGWNDPSTKSAFVQGLAVDATDVYNRYHFASKITDPARPIWKTWKVNGKYYALPQEYNVGNGIYYRRDLVEQLDLEVPKPGWTWDDLRALAKGLTQGKRKGIALQQWGISWALDAQAFNLLTTIPAPDTGWHWKWDYTSKADRWTAVVENFRGMVFEDGSVLSDVSYVDGDVQAAFGNGRAAMMPNNAGFFTGDPDAENTPAHLAKQMGKEPGEVYGWIQHPLGLLGHVDDTQGFTTLLSFSPDIDDEGLDKAASLHDYMGFGDGYVHRKQASWESTKDLKKVYTAATPINGMTRIPGINGTIEDAWGSDYMEAVRAASTLPKKPDTTQFMPVEENSGPEATAITDAESKWSFERGRRDISADLRQAASTRNQQAQSFTSSVSKEDFVSGARRYYEAHRDLWRQYAPKFSEEIFEPWFEQEVAPVLG